METLKEHKDLLDVAEHFFENGKLIQAISYATASLDLTMSFAKTIIFDLEADEASSLEDLEGLIVQDEFGKQKVNFKVSEEFQKMEEILLCSILKIDYNNYFKYRKWVGHAMITGADTPDKKIKLSLEIQDNLEPDQARNALDYCQQIVQKLEKEVEQFQASFIETYQS